MDAQKLSRLVEEQVSAIQVTEDQIATWEKFESDYNNLEKKLILLPDKLSYDVMVPLCPVALVPGRMIHTNELLVLLGDNWFVDRSAKQAAEIVARRKQKVHSSLNDLRSQRQLLVDRFKATDALQSEAEGDFFEIREEFDQREDSKWKEEHRRHLRDERARKQAQSSTTLSDAALWRRLEKLELQEQSNQELEQDAEESRRSARVRWQNATSDSSETSEEQESTSDSSEEAASDSSEEQEAPVIHFRHSQNTSVEIQRVEPGPAEGGDSSRLTPHCPADLYAMVAHTPSPSPSSIEPSTSRPPKGILKREPTDFRRVEKEREQRASEIWESPTRAAPEVEAVSSVVHERPVAHPAPLLNNQLAQSSGPDHLPCSESAQISCTTHQTDSHSVSKTTNCPPARMSGVKDKSSGMLSLDAHHSDVQLETRPVSKFKARQQQRNS